MVIWNMVLDMFTVLRKVDSGLVNILPFSKKSTVYLSSVYFWQSLSDQKKHCENWSCCWVCLWCIIFCLGCKVGVLTPLCLFSWLCLESIRCVSADILHETLSTTGPCCYPRSINCSSCAANTILSLPMIKAGVDSLPVLLIFCMKHQLLQFNWSLLLLL